MASIEASARGHRARTAAMVVAALGGLLGCASKGQPTGEPNEGSTVEGVIEARLLRGLFPYQREERRKGRGEITFDAAFNEVNFAQLTEPQRVLKEYCVRSGGSFAQLARSRVSAALMAKPALTAAQAFEQHKQAYSQLGMSERAAAVTAALDTQFYEAAVQGQYPKAIRDTLAAADQAGAFGMFDCRVSGRPAWVMMVEPVRFNPMKNSQSLLGSPTMTLYVKGAMLSQP